MWIPKDSTAALEIERLQSKIDDLSKRLFDLEDQFEAKVDDRVDDILRYHTTVIKTYEEFIPNLQVFVEDKLKSTPKDILERDFLDDLQWKFGDLDCAIQSIKR